MTEKTLAGGFLAAGIPLPRPIEQAAKASRAAQQRYRAAKAEAVRVANSDDAYNRRRAEFNFAQAEKLEDLDAWVPFAEPRPNIEEAKEKADAYKRVADLRRRYFDAELSYRVGFDLIEDAWRSRVEWRRRADSTALTLAEAERLEREADKLAPLLLNLSAMLASREFSDRLERKEYKRSVSTAGRPLDFEAWRRDRDRKRAASNNVKVEVEA